MSMGCFSVPCACLLIVEGVQKCAVVGPREILYSRVQNLGVTPRAGKFPHVSEVSWRPRPLARIAGRQVCRKLLDDCSAVADVLLLSGEN